MPALPKVDTHIPRESALPLIIAAILVALQGFYTIIQFATGAIIMLMLGLSC